MKYCCNCFEVNVSVPSTTSPNIRIVKFTKDFPPEYGTVYGFFVTMGYAKFDLNLPKLAIKFCPYCGAELRNFYRSDEFANEIEGETFANPD